MVRVIFVRHGESQENRRDFEFGVRVSRKIMSQQERERAVAAITARSEPNGDTFLTENGHEQARLLGQYWAPMLTRKAREGKLHVFVSPMQRNLETADPLMRRLRDALGNSFTATVNVDLFEGHGLVRPSDRREMAEQMKHLAQRVGKLSFDDWRDSQESQEPAQRSRFQRCGLTPNEMRAKFPWVAIPEGAFAGPDEGWWCGGLDSEVKLQQRTVRVVDWLESLRDSLPATDIVLMITHGDQTHRMLNALLARAFLGRDAGLPALRGSGSVNDRPGWVELHPKSNTSTSCITLNRGENLSLDFFHRVDHLGKGTAPDTLMRGYQYIGLDNQQGNRSPKLSESGDLVGFWGLRLGPALAPLQRELGTSKL